ncbi:hypothetical protein MMPV_002425 [Pyropia vietnamensis]
METIATGYRNRQPRRPAALFGRGRRARRRRVLSWTAGVVVVAAAAITSVVVATTEVAGGGLVAAEVSEAMQVDPGVALPRVTPRPSWPPPGASLAVAGGGEPTSDDKGGSGRGSAGDNGGVKEVDSGKSQVRGDDAKAGGRGGGAVSRPQSSPASTQGPPPLTPELVKAVAIGVAAATETDPSGWALMSEEPSQSSHDESPPAVDGAATSVRTSRTGSGEYSRSDGAKGGAQQLCTLVTTFPAAAAADVNRSLIHLESYIQEGQLDEDLAASGDSAPLLVRVERGPTLLLRTPQGAPLGPSESATVADGSGLSASKLTGIVIGALAGATTLVVAAVVLGGAALRRHAAVAGDGRNPSSGGGGGGWGGGGTNDLRSAGGADGSGGGAGSSAASSIRRPFDGSSTRGFGAYVPPADSGAVRGVPEPPPLAGTYGGSPDHNTDYGGWEGEAPAYSPPPAAVFATGNEAAATWAASAAAATAARPPLSPTYPDGSTLVGVPPSQTLPPPATPAVAGWDSPGSDGSARGPVTASPPSSPYAPPGRVGGLPLVAGRGEVGSLARPPSGRSLSGGLPSGPSDMSAGSIRSGTSIGVGGDPLIAAAAAGHLVRSPSGERGRRVVSSFAGRPPPPPAPAPLAPLPPSGSESSSMAGSDASGTPRSSLASSEGSSGEGTDTVASTVVLVSGGGDETDGSASAASAYYDIGPVGAGGSGGGGGGGRGGYAYRDNDGASIELDVDVDDTFGDAELSGDLAGGWDAPPPSMAPSRFRRPLVAGAAVASPPQTLAAHELNPLAVPRSVSGDGNGPRMRPSVSTGSASSSSSHRDALPTGAGAGGRRTAMDMTGRAGSFATPSSEGSASSDGLWAPDPPPPPSMRVVGRGSGVPPRWQPLRHV